MDDLEVESVALDKGFLVPPSTKDRVKYGMGGGGDGGAIL